MIILWCKNVKALKNNIDADLAFGMTNNYHFKEKNAFAKYDKMQRG